MLRPPLSIGLWTMRESSPSDSIGYDFIFDCTSRLSKLANKGTEGGGGDGHCSSVAEHWRVKPEALGLTSSGATSLSCLAVA